jgi:Tol biopolymer transport system component
VSNVSATCITVTLWFRLGRRAESRYNLEVRLGKGAIGGACAGAALLVLQAAGAGPGSTTRVSIAFDSGQGNGASFVPAISGDGRFVAFYSDATNLVANDTNGARDVFVRDLGTGGTIRASVSSSGAEANGDSFAPALSADGRYVAFSSAATNLVDGDTNDANDIFIRDLQTSTTTRVSVGFDGSQANGGSDQPSLSGDGRLVAFTSVASNIVNGDLNNLRDAFVYDRRTGTAQDVSVATDGTQGDLESATPVLSADGKFVAYSSFADNLIADDENEGNDIFVRDLTANTTERVSEYTGHYEGEGDSQRPSISADGRYVAFDSDDWDLVWGDTNDSFDVFVNDRATTVTTRVSVDDQGTQSNADSFRPSISADGRYVAFYSEASNLVSGDANGSTDVFVYDRRSGATKRVSVAAGGEEASGDSVRPALDGSGRLAAFESDATNLVAGDTNRFTDVFVRDPLGVPPPPPQVTCRVPRVIGMWLAVARGKIANANCNTGRVRRARSAKKRVGKVLSQSPKAGSVRPRGTKVNLLVGRR